MKKFILIFPLALVCSACSPKWSMPTKEVAYAECMANLERIKYHPDEQSYWNKDGDARVIKAWCKVDETHPSYTKDGLGQVIPHFQYTSRESRAFSRKYPKNSACTRGICTIYPGKWHTYPLKTN